MVANRSIFIGIATLLVAFCCSVSALEGDAEWQKVSEVVEELKNPKTPPTSREQAVTMLKTGLTNFDTALAEAVKVAPKHPTRWDAALFEVMVEKARTMAGVPAPQKSTVTLEDILKAEDAKPSTKSEASVVSVMTALQAAEKPGGDTAVWISKAESHLKAFPAEPMNRMVEGKVKAMQAAAELKSKPLELKFTTVDGKAFDLASLQGKVVLIDFWATWCGPCVAELPNVIKAYQELHPKGFEIVGISLDQDKEKLLAFVKEKGMEWPQYFDGKGWQNEISTKYGISSIPAMWLVNKKGMVVSTNARGGLEETVAKLLAE